MLDPNYESQHNLRTSEDQSQNRQLNADQENNRLSDNLLHPNFLEYLFNAMMNSHNHVHTNISETISPLTEHLSDPTLEDYHENNRTILDLANETQEIIHQSALVSMEITFIEEYQGLLYQTAPEPQLPFLPPSTHNQHFNPLHSPTRRPFRQRRARSAPSEQQLPNTSRPMDILAGVERVFLLPQPWNIIRRRRMRHPGSAQRQCISLKVFGSDAVRVPTYFFHAPTGDCHHGGKFYLEHLDSSSPDCLIAHRYVMCSPSIEKQDDPQNTNTDCDTEIR